MVVFHLYILAQFFSVSLCTMSCADRETTKSYEWLSKRWKRQHCHNRRMDKIIYIHGKKENRNSHFFHWAHKQVHSALLQGVLEATSKKEMSRKIEWISGLKCTGDNDHVWLYKFRKWWLWVRRHSRKREILFCLFCSSMVAPSRSWAGADASAVAAG